MFKCYVIYLRYHLQSTEHRLKHLQINVDYILTFISYFKGLAPDDETVLRFSHVVLIFPRFSESPTDRKNRVY